MRVAKRSERGGETTPTRYSQQAGTTGAVTAAGVIREQLGG